MTKGPKNVSLFLAVGFIALILIVSVLSDLLLGLVGWNLDFNIEKINLPPFRNPGNILGTNELGQSVMALIISGAKYSISISVLSAFFATVIGMLIGAIAGYFGDKSIQVKRYDIINLLIVVPVFWFYTNLSLEFNNALKSIVALILAMTVSYFIWKLLTFLLTRNKFLDQPVNLPIDILNTKLTEIVFAIPSYFIILSFAFILGNSIWSIIMVLSITSWPQSALLMRAEMIKIRDLNYVKALNLSGIGHFQILLRHAIPNAMSPVLVNFVFFVSGLLIIESTLSYIGIGLSADITTWGKAIAGFKHNTANWWVALFPGLIIFLTILSFHRIGGWLQKKLL